MNLRTLFWLSVITGCLMAPIVQGQTTVTRTINFDGFDDGQYNASSNSGYANTENIGWINGHHTENSAYGDGSGTSTTWDQTTMRWGSALQEGDTSGQKYFFLYIEAPLYAKDMQWSPDAVNDTNIVDFYQYDLGGKNLHQSDSKVNDLDYGNATGSERINWGGTDSDPVKREDYKSDFPGGASGTGIIAVKDSIDYLLSNGLITDSSGNTVSSVGDLDDNTKSYNADIPMAFEFKFQSWNDFEAARDAARLGVVFHLSPEKIPEPSSALLLSVASLGMLLRRKR